MPRISAPEERQSLKYNSFQVLGQNGERTLSRIRQWRGKLFQMTFTQDFDSFPTLIYKPSHGASGCKICSQIQRDPRIIIIIIIMIIFTITIIIIITKSVLRSGGTLRTSPGFQVRGSAGGVAVRKVKRDEVRNISRVYRSYLCKCLCLLHTRTVLHLTLPSRRGNA